MTFNTVCPKHNNTIGLWRAELFECRILDAIGHCLTVTANRKQVILLTQRATRRLSELAQQTYVASLA